MNFYNAFNRPQTIASPEGCYSHYETTYTEKLIEGKLEVVEDGVVNHYDNIQAYADDGNIALTIDRLQNGFQVNLLPEGTFADVTEAPRTLAEAQSVIIGLRSEFENLSPELRDRFGNSSELYISTYGSAEWAKNLGLVAPEPKNMPEVKEDPVHES